MATTKKLAWGILGPGAIADAFVRGVQMGNTGEVVAVGSRTLDKAKAFAEKFNIARTHGSYEALLADDAVEAVYIATPHPMHPEWAIKAAEAGKHILCEKPLALNAAQAQAMIEAAREAPGGGVFFMEAFMYRCNPQTVKLVELLKHKVIGEVKLIRATFGFSTGFNPNSRLFSNALGGGGIMDVGCYTASMARLVAGAADGKPYLDPVEVTGSGELCETGVDAVAAATLKFPNGIVAQIATAVRASLDNHVTIFGSEGRIVLTNPWIANRTEATPGRIEIHKGGNVEVIDIPNDRTSFSYEADFVAQAIARGDKQPAPPAMTWGDTLGNLATLDRWRQAVGVTFQAETSAAQGKLTLANRPLARLRGRTKSNMRYARVPGIDKDISKLVCGCDNQVAFGEAAVRWDDWFERGGNAFDTAHLYANGRQERLLGEWIKTRGVRDQVVILSKGGHTPFCTPEGIDKQLRESLDRLQVDHVELYILHRDNLDIPVGELVDALHEHAEAGRIRVFGGSNWTLPRIIAANDYAAKHGKRPFGATSNNLSLAEMVKPVWGGCTHVSDTDSRRWYAENNMPNFAWSSQARGYFLPEGERLKLGQGNFECWDSPANRARRARAEELAAKYGVSPINIAAAYVLNQPFPSFALIGPRTIHETATCMPALDIELTQEEIDWLWDAAPGIALGEPALAGGA